MSSEIDELRKGLEAAEKRDLLIVKMIGRLMFPMELRTATKFLKGEEIKSFREWSDKKLHASNKELEDAQTIKDAFDAIYKFDQELATYVRAQKVDTADKAMEIAHSFIKKYVPVALPMKAEREEDVWLVDVDVGALAVKVAKIKVDARTGDILSYEIPPK